MLLCICKEEIKLKKLKKGEMNMKSMTIKSWIYEKIQTDAQKYMKTIVWDKKYTYDESGNEQIAYKIGIADIIKETEKAVYVNCEYWSTKSRTVNFTIYNGFKVWIPKSAILETV